MSSPPSLLASDYYGPAIAASCFVLFMSRVAEPARRTFNAILVAGTCGAYLNGGFGPWELAYPTRDASRLCRTAILHFHWNRVADPCGMGPGAPSVGQSYLAIHADLFLGVLGLRRNHRDLVPCRCACANRTWNQNSADGVTLSRRLATVGPSGNQVAGVISMAAHQR